MSTGKKVPRLALFATALAVPAFVFVMRLVVLTTHDTGDSSLSGPWTLSVQPLFAGGSTVGPSSTMATSSSGGAADAPPKEFSPLCGPVQFVAPTNSSCSRLGQSTKLAARAACPASFAASPTPSTEFGLLITGMGGFFQEAAFAWWRSRGIMVSRDNAPPTAPFGSASWVLAFNNWDQYPNYAKLEATKNIAFEHVVLQVRNPLDHIASRGVITAPNYVDTHVIDGMPPGPEPLAKLHRALKYYVVWHEQLLAVADQIVRVEDANMNDVCWSTPFASKCPGPESTDPEGAAEALQQWKDLVAKDMGKEKFPKTSWTELLKVDPGYAKRAMAIAATLGYCTTDAPGVEPPSFVEGWEEYRKRKDSGGKATKPFEPPRAEFLKDLALQRIKPAGHTMRFMSGMVVSGKDPQVPAGLKGAKDAEAGMGPGPGRIDGLGGFEGAVVIPAPSWLKESERLGNFYLYSSFRRGRFIRLSVANDITGPYTLVDTPALSMTAFPMCGGHMASPHAVVDDVSQTVLLHFHCGVCVAGETYTCGMAGEVTFGASSSNGATFDALPKVLWKQQLKSVRIGSWVYSFSEHEVFASPDGLTGLQSVGYVYASYVTPALIGSKLYFVWSSEKGAIMYARIDVSAYDTTKQLPDTVWATVPEGQKILVAEEAWELASSSTALRYPALNPYKDAEGKTQVVLTYSPANGDGVGMVHVSGMVPSV